MRTWIGWGVLAGSLWAQSAGAQGMNDGRLLASGCFQCHGTNGKGPGFEQIYGKSTDEIYKDLKEMQAGKEGQGLMTKTFDEELSGRVAFIMDCGQSGDLKILDDCARAAGSLMFAALDEGHHVEWIDLASLNRLIVPPFSDGHELLDTLARIELTRDCLQPDRLRNAVDRVSRKSAIVLLLTETNDAVADFVGELAARGRRVSVYLPEKGVSTGGLGGVPMFTYSGKEIHSLA